MHAEISHYILCKWKEGGRVVWCERKNTYSNVTVGGGEGGKLLLGVREMHPMAGAANSSIIHHTNSLPKFIIQCISAITLTLHWTDTIIMFIWYTNLVFDVTMVICILCNVHIILHNNCRKMIIMYSISYYLGNIF